MGSVGTALGAVEFFGTIVMLLMLVGGLNARRRRFTPVAVIAIVFRIVFANPFGVVTRESTTDPGPPLAVVTNGRFGEEGCPQLAARDARSECRAGARSMEGALVTFS